MATKQTRTPPTKRNKRRSKKNSQEPLKTFDVEYMNLENKNGPLLILGGGDTFKKDWEFYKELFDDNPSKYCYIMAVNDQVYTYTGRIDYFVTLHGEKMQGWFEKRKQMISNPSWNFNIFCHRSERWENTEHDITLENSNFDQSEFSTMNYTVRSELWTGSSGLYGCQIGLYDIGFEKILLAGVPMTKGINIFRQKNWKMRDFYWKGWTKAYPFIKDHVRSASGATKDLLGYPTEEFLRE